MFGNDFRKNRDENLALSNSSHDAFPRNAENSLEEIDRTGLVLIILMMDLTSVPYWLYKYFANRTPDST